MTQEKLEIPTNYINPLLALSTITQPRNLTMDYQGMAQQYLSNVQEVQQNLNPIFSPPQEEVKTMLTNPPNQAIQNRNVIEPSRDEMINHFINQAKSRGYNDNQIAIGLAQIEGESGFQNVKENKFSYDNLMKAKTDPKAYSGYKTMKTKLQNLTPQQIRNIVDNDKEYFEFMYGGRKDLGNVNKGDGYNYRGRGFLQLTGRSNYERIGKLIGKDLVNNPDLLNDPMVAMEASLQYLIDRKVLNAKDLLTATKLVHGSANNHITNKQRSEYYNQYTKLLNKLKRG